MNLRRTLSAVAALGLLAACASDPDVLYEVAQPPAQGRIGVSAATVEVRDVTLPLYAAQEPIAVEVAPRQIIAGDKTLWADDPVRQVTLALSVALSDITRARVAAEPWPFADPADARLEVRFTRALAGADGAYRMSGQYYVASPLGDGRDVAREFDIARPWVVGNIASIAVAKGLAIDDLARQIARDGL